MGILNVTPDSFSDGSAYLHFNDALAHAKRLLNEGADIIDIGGESTRPGAREVSIDDEISRVVPLVEKVKSLGGIVSVDTSKPEVMLAAIEAGVDMINDVRALSLPGALEVVAESQLPVCLMHMLGQPKNMQSAPQYQSVVTDIFKYLKQRVEVCLSAGIESSYIAIDPGFGFGKTLQHNLDLLTQLSSFQNLKCPILVGLSRKSMIGQITGREVCDRLAGSLGLALIAMQQGAKIIRVHDVKQTVDIKKIFLATQNEQ